MSTTETPETKGDGETWEAYAHRLEERIKQQREHLRGVNELDGHRRRDLERIASLERLVGRKSLTIDQHRIAVRALTEKLDGMFSLREVQMLVALTNGGDYNIIGDAIPQEVWDELHDRRLVSTHSFAPGDDPQTSSTSDGIDYVVERVSVRNSTSPDDSRVMTHFTAGARVTPSFDRTVLVDLADLRPELPAERDAEVVRQDAYAGTVLRPAVGRVVRTADPEWAAENLYPFNAEALAAAQWKNGAVLVRWDRIPGDVWWPADSLVLDRG